MEPEVTELPIELEYWLGRPKLPDEVMETASDETLWERVREVRNQLLAESDWTQLTDVPLPNQEEWQAYRQALRDLTVVADPRNVVLPTKPEA
jgi:hypothetical protein